MTTTPDTKTELARDAELDRQIRSVANDAIFNVVATVFWGLLFLAMLTRVAQDPATYYLLVLVGLGVLAFCVLAMQSITKHRELLAVRHGRP